jgi:hypothetical protein
MANAYIFQSRAASERNERVDFWGNAEAFIGTKARHLGHADITFQDYFCLIQNGKEPF